MGRYVNTGKYLVNQPKAGFVPEFFGAPNESIEYIRMPYMDDEVVRGGRYLETVWFTKGSEDVANNPHCHDFDEFLGFFGSDLEHPEELCGEIEQTIDGDQYVMTKSCLVFIPKGVVHNPLYIRRVDRPIFHFATGDAKLYHGDKA